MPTLVREQLLNAITTAVSGEYGIPAPEDERDLPVTIVRDGEETATSGAYNRTDIAMLVNIGRGAVAVSSERTALRTQAHGLLADVITQMFVDETFGGLADSVEYNGGAIQAELGKLCLAEAQFIVNYHTVRGDPYTIE